MIDSFENKTPSVHPSAYVHPTAVLVGDVSVGADCSVWAYAVLRGDIGSIVIEEGSNIQEHVLIHTSIDSNVHIGKYVTIGHQAIIHGATIEDEVLIGMASILLDHAHIKKHSVVGAGALITSNKTFDQASLLLGSPAKKIKQVSEKEISEIIINAKHYIELKEKHRGEQ